MSNVLVLCETQTKFLILRLQLKIIFYIITYVNTFFNVGTLFNVNLYLGITLFKQLFKLTIQKIGNILFIVNINTDMNTMSDHPIIILRRNTLKIKMNRKNLY